MEAAEEIQEIEVEKRGRSTSELVAAVEALIYVSDEPLTAKLLADVLDENK